MLETMLALKNNDMRKIPGYDPEPVEKLRKLQRALVSNFLSWFILNLCGTIVTMKTQMGVCLACERFKIEQKLRAFCRESFRVPVRGKLQSPIFFF
jgi:hypothetical protein